MAFNPLRFSLEHSSDGTVNGQISFSRYEIYYLTALHGLLCCSGVELKPGASVAFADAIALATMQTIEAQNKAFAENETPVKKINVGNKVVFYHPLTWCEERGVVTHVGEEVIIVKYKIFSDQHPEGMDHVVDLSASDIVYIL